MLNMLLLLFFPAMMAYAACSDLLTMRISNKVSLLLIVGFFIMALLAGLTWPDIGMHAGVAAITLVVAFSFFAFGWIGGGDAKLAAATVLWIGPEHAMVYLVFAALYGGGLTLLFLFGRNYSLPAGLLRVGWLVRLHDKSEGVPYGIALAAAAMMVYPETAIFQIFAS
ncbi:A24 family peptidase [Mariluticola halotolerans]|uniref:A24 family peptidase n=1 Tax=Mariluticola halotolerans TaxID=2909283 RepID=UPI0026E255C0|nr:prepilin peptidase [Mariluticola halotolerans]UJQ93165.1 prepilin peptidase [Mariluticola halotolerans]